jgi:hypothetical protein
MRDFYHFHIDILGFGISVIRVSSWGLEAVADQAVGLAGADPVDIGEGLGKTVLLQKMRGSFFSYMPESEMVMKWVVSWTSRELSEGSVDMLYLKCPYLFLII